MHVSQIGDMSGSRSRSRSASPSPTYSGPAFQWVKLTEANIDDLCKGWELVTTIDLAKAFVRHGEVSLSGKRKTKANCCAALASALWKPPVSIDQAEAYIASMSSSSTSCSITTDSSLPSTPVTDSSSSSSVSSMSSSSLPSNSTSSSVLSVSSSPLLTDFTYPSSLPAPSFSAPHLSSGPLLPPGVSFSSTISQIHNWTTCSPEDLLTGAWMIGVDVSNWHRDAIVGLLTAALPFPGYHILAICRNTRSSAPSSSFPPTNPYASTQYAASHDSSSGASFSSYTLSSSECSTSSTTSTSCSWPSATSVSYPWSSSASGSSGTLSVATTSQCSSSSMPSSSTSSHYHPHLASPSSSNTLAHTHNCGHKRSRSPDGKDSKHGNSLNIYNISDSIFEKAKNLEYTPIFDLFPPSAYEITPGIFISDSGDISSKRRKALPPFPRDYSTWSEAADVLFQIRDDFHPSLRQSNKEYKDFIRQRYKEWHPVAVWRWDSLWRQEAARLGVPLSPVSQVFWAQHFPSIAKLGEGRTSSFKGCVLCPSEHHTEKVCPLRSLMFFPDSLFSNDFPRAISRAPDRRDRLRHRYSKGDTNRTNDRIRSTGRHVGRPQPPSICDFFNLPRGCKKSQCNYNHICARCKSKEHSAPNCKN